MEEYLMKLLECPVCLEYMIPPITFCRNGHNICSSCKPNLLRCPTCRGDFLNVRNKFAEDVSASIEHPCKYHKSGCTRKLRVGPKEKHENECRFQPHKCPYHIVPSIKCSWEGGLGDMKKHIRNTHEKHFIKIFKQEMQLTTITNYFKNVDRPWFQTVFTLDNIFFYFCKVIDNLVYMCYMYVGAREDTNDFEYTICMNSCDGDQCVALTLVCPNYQDFIGGEFPNGKCAVFQKDFTMLCTVKENELPYDFVIFRKH